MLDRGLTDATEIPVAVAAGGAAAALALFAVTVDETDEAFANIYSTAVSLQNLVPRVPQWLLIVAVSTVSTIGALTIDLAHYLDFLYLLGSCFVPLFGVLLADWLVAGMRYRRDDFFAAPAFRPALIGAWVAGFRALPVAPARRPGLVDGPRRERASRRSGRSARRSPASRSRSYSRGLQVLCAAL